MELQRVKEDIKTIDAHKQECQRDTSLDALINELKSKIISCLKLSDVTPDRIDTDAPLIGGGLGLDSIDTLELLVMLERDYDVTVPDVNVGRGVFQSVRSLAAYVAKHREDSKTS